MPVELLIVLVCSPMEQQKMPSKSRQRSEKLKADADLVVRQVEIGKALAFLISADCLDFTWILNVKYQLCCLKLEYVRSVASLSIIHYNLFHSYFGTCYN